MTDIGLVEDMSGELNYKERQIAKLSFWYLKDQ